MFTDERGQPFTYSILHRELRQLLSALFGEQTASCLTWHSIRIGLACALHAADCPDAVIQLICRWTCPESLHVYRQMGIDKNLYWTEQAQHVTFDATRVNNLPALDADTAILDNILAFDPPAAGPQPAPPPVQFIISLGGRCRRVNPILWVWLALLSRCLAPFGSLRIYTIARPRLLNAPSLRNACASSFTPMVHERALTSFSTVGSSSPSNALRSSLRVSRGRNAPLFNWVSCGFPPTHPGGTFLFFTPLRASNLRSRQPFNGWSRQPLHSSILTLSTLVISSSSSQH